MGTNTIESRLQICMTHVREQDITHKTFQIDLSNACLQTIPLWNYSVPLEPLEPLNPLGMLRTPCSQQ